MIVCPSSVRLCWAHRLHTILQEGLLSSFEKFCQKTLLNRPGVTKVMEQITQSRAQRGGWRHPGSRALLHCSPCAGVHFCPDPAAVWTPALGCLAGTTTLQGQAVAHLASPRPPHPAPAQCPTFPTPVVSGSLAHSSIHA